MLTVLVTGSMGAGKSSAIDFLELKSYPVFRADIQAKQLLRPQSPCYQQLKQLFEEKCLVKQSGEFDRKKLAEDIFNFPEKRKVMESIVHPFVQKSFKQFVKNQKNLAQNSIVFYEAPLISQDVFDSVDKRILLVCPRKIKIKRLMKRNWTETEILKRWAVQIPESKIRDKMDFIIDNSGNLTHLYKHIDEILLQLLKR